jgi:hypothetical protein
MADFKRVWEWQYPESYSGLVWVHVRPKPETRFQDHPYTILWGPWQYRSVLKFGSEQSVALVHTKGNDGPSGSIIFDIHPPCSVHFGQGNVPSAAVIEPINDEWTLVGTASAGPGPKKEDDNPGEIPPSWKAIASLAGIVLGCVFGLLVASSISGFFMGFLLGLGCVSLAFAVAKDDKKWTFNRISLVTLLGVTLLIATVGLLLAGNAVARGMFLGAFLGLLVGYLVGALTIWKSTELSDLSPANYYASAAFLLAASLGIKSSVMLFVPGSQPAQSASIQGSPISSK